MKVFLGADHRGFKLKEAVKQWLLDRGEIVEDMGNSRFDPEDDFPDFAAAVAEKVSAGFGRGIVICGSGGMALTANKFKNVRAVECWNETAAKHAKAHDHCNVLMLPADFVAEDLAKQIIAVWLETEALIDAKRQRRLNKITEIERKNFI